MVDTKMTDEQVIARAAVLIAGRHQNAALAPILEAQMRHIAESVPTSGGSGYVQWIARVRALGEMLISIAKQEETTAKNMRL